jgi:hypothetical protein
MRAQKTSWLRDHAKLGAALLPPRTNDNDTPMPTRGAKPLSDDENNVPSAPTTATLNMCQQQQCWLRANYAEPPIAQELSNNIDDIGFVPTMERTLRLPSLSPSPLLSPLPLPLPMVSLQILYWVVTDGFLVLIIQGKLLKNIRAIRNTPLIITDH